MRITITLEDDVAAELRRLRDDLELSTSEAVHVLARRGMAAQMWTTPYRQAPIDLGAMAGATNTAAVEDLLDSL